MDSDWVCDQLRLYLIDPLRRYLAEQGRPAYVSGDTFVYFVDPQSEKIRRLGPDFYVVLGGESRGQTKWVAWEEGDRLPTLVIEFMSTSTEVRDRGKKFCIYRDVFKTKDYFLVRPETLSMEGYQLTRGHYLAANPNSEGWYWIDSLQLLLGVHDGWLRFKTSTGDLLTTGLELAQQERARAEQERARADEERARADQSEARLQELEAELSRLRGQVD